MILCTPLIPKLTDYTAYAEDIRKRGKLLNHLHLVVSRQEDEAEAYEFGQGLSDLFLRSNFFAIPEKKRGGLQLANDLFRAAARCVSEHVSREGELSDPALLYMDPSYRPLSNRWLDEIQADYYFRKAPMFFGRFTPEEHLLQGPVVISKAMYKASGLLAFVPENIHWRTYLRHEVNANSAETKLIGHGSGESVLRQKAITKKPTQ